MYQITYTVGIETKKILVDGSYYHQYAELEKLIKHVEPNTELEIKILEDSYVGSTYNLPVIQPIGNINDI